MSPEPIIDDWRKSTSVSNEARAFLGLFNPPDAPYHFNRFLAGVRRGAAALPPNRSLTYEGRGLDELLAELEAVHGAGLESTQTHWNQDAQRGTGLEAYRSFAQIAPPTAAAGFGCLQGVLLGLLLLSNDRSIKRGMIKSLTQFVRLAGDSSKTKFTDDRRKIVAVLPAIFDGSTLVESLERSKGQFPLLATRIDEVIRAVTVLALRLGAFELRNKPDRVSPSSSESDQPVLPRSPTSRRREQSSKPKSSLQGVSIESETHAEIPGSLYFGSANGVDDARRIDIAAAAETSEDQETSTEGVSADEVAGAQSLVQRRAAAMRYRSDVRQGFWARIQWDALTPGEMQHTIARLYACWQEAVASGDHLLKEAAALALLSGVTGFPLARSHMTKACIVSGGEITDAEANDSPVDQFDATDGSLSIPLIVLEARYKPTTEQAAHLEPVEQRTLLFLPPEIADVLATLQPSPDGYLFGRELEHLEARLRKIFSEARETEPRYTIARLSRGHQLEVLGCSGDVASAQMITGQTLGASATPIAYYAARANALQDIYNRAVSASGLDPSPKTHPGEARVGSQLVLKPKTIASVVKFATQGILYTPRKSHSTGRQLLELHERLVPSLALLWMAGTGFRPTFRLGQITSASFDLRAALAVISDKQSDEGHIGRLVPLSATLVSSLAAYGKHLRLMASESRLTPAQRSSSQDALSGTGPLFFIFGPSGPKPLAPKDLLSRLPHGWNLPLNFLRHRLATRLRDLGCPAPFVQALIGHHELGIQPFGDESFLEPSEFLKSTREHVESLLQSDGWRPLLGVTGSLDVDVFNRESTAISVDVISLENSLEKKVTTAYQAQRSAVEVARTQQGAKIDEDVQAAVRSSLPDLLERPEDIHEVSKAQVTQLRKDVCASAENMIELELRVLSLRALLKDGRDLHGWRVERLPNFYPLNVVASTHHPAFIQPYSAQQQLRERFLLHLEKKSKSPESASSLLNCVLALILWHGVSDRQRLQDILKGIPRGERLHGSRDAFVVPALIYRHSEDPDPAETCEVLRGPVALAALTAKPYLEGGWNFKDIEVALLAWVPKSIVLTTRTKILDAMLAIASLSHRFESPGPMRNIWTNQVMSVSLPMARIHSLFGAHSSSGVITLDEAPESQGTTTTVRIQSSTLTWNRKQYQWAKDTLRYVRRRSKTFPADPMIDHEINSSDTGKNIAVIHADDAGIRKQTCERLEQRLACWPQDHSFVRALTAYAFDRLKFGTPWQNEIEQSTAYKYLVGAGTLLLAHGTGANISEMDAEDFRELYAICIATAPLSFQRELRSYLAYFHGFLIEKYRCPSVAIGDRYESYLCLPDIGYVTPREINMSGSWLQAVIDGSDGVAGTTYEIDCAKAALFLAFSTGARTSETLLREDRELVLDPGRGAFSIKRNRWTRVKTYHGTRVIDLESYFPEPARSALENWRTAQASVRLAHEIQRAPLFPHPGNRSIPIDPARLTHWIGNALRASTGCPNARQYWSRHTMASIEFFFTYVDDNLYQDLLTSTAEVDRVWLPSCSQIRDQSGAGLPLGQAQAAGYRSRRGHASMRTSQESYIHLACLIEPWSSRSAANELSPTAIASLAGATSAAVRKRMSRARISANSPRDAVKAFIKRTESRPTMEVVSEVVTHRIPPKAIDADALMTGLIRSVQIGNLATLATALRLTGAAMAGLNNALASALAENAYGLALPNMQPTSSSTSLLSTAQSPQVLPTLDRIDRPWVQGCLNRMMSDRELADGWRVVMRGIDLRTGAIAIENEEDLNKLLRTLPRAIGQSEKGKYSVRLISNGKLSPEQLDTLFALIGTSDDHKDKVTSTSIDVPHGWIRVGVAIEKRPAGRRVVGPIALLSIAAAVLRWHRDL